MIIVSLHSGKVPAMKSFSFLNETGRDVRGDCANVHTMRQPTAALHANDSNGGS